MSSSELEGAGNVQRGTFRTMLCGRTGIHHEFISASEAEMGRVISGAQGESLVIWVVGILLTHGGINIVWISVRPRLDGLAACSTYESETLCHGILISAER